MRIIRKETLQALEIALTTNKSDMREFTNSVFFKKDEAISTDGKLLLISEYSYKNNEENFPETEITANVSLNHLAPRSFIKACIKNNIKNNTLDIIDNKTAIEADENKLYGTNTDLENYNTSKTKAITEKEQPYPDVKTFSAEWVKNLKDSSKTTYNIKIIERAIKIAKLMGEENITITAPIDATKPSQIKFKSETKTTIFIMGMANNS